MTNRRLFIAILAMTAMNFAVACTRNLLCGPERG